MPAVAAIKGPGARGTSGAALMHAPRLSRPKAVSVTGAKTGAAPAMPSALAPKASSSYLPQRLPNPDQNPGQAFSKGGSVQKPMGKMGKQLSCKTY